MALIIAPAISLLVAPSIPSTPGEELTDGECIDIVWGIIEKLGWDLHELMSNKTIIYNIQQKKEEK
jgi:hypothetical protein